MGYHMKITIFPVKVIVADDSRPAGHKVAFSCVYSGCTHGEIHKPSLVAGLFHSICSPLEHGHFVAFSLCVSLKKC